MAGVNAVQIVVNEVFQGFGAWLISLMQAITFLGQ
jgi:hypothetical protein